MSFKIIKGTFHIVGYSPDGDSIRFKADDPSNWDSLSGRKVKLNSKDHAQLRIEAIDTLETHYKNEHQPIELAKGATNYLFKRLDIKDVVWNDKGSRVKSAKDGVPGYIATRTTDRYGRPISFLFDNSNVFQDGEKIYLDNSIVKKSVNYKLLLKGLAYPTFYDGMFYDLRELFAKTTQKARKKEKGVWRVDKTNQFLKVEHLTDITENYVVMPKLFRRMTAYLKNHNDIFNADEFLKELEDSSEKVLIVSILHFTHFDNLMKPKNQNKIKLTQKPENIIFLS